MNTTSWPLLQAVSLSVNFWFFLESDSKPDREAAQGEKLPQAVA